MDVYLTAYHHVVSAAAGVGVAPDVLDAPAHGDAMQAILIELMVELAGVGDELVDVAHAAGAALVVVSVQHNWGAAGGLGEGRRTQVLHRAIRLLDGDVQLP